MACQLLKHFNSSWKEQDISKCLLTFQHPAQVSPSLQNRGRPRLPDLVIPSSVPSSVTRVLHRLPLTWEDGPRGRVSPPVSTKVPAADVPVSVE